MTICAAVHDSVPPIRCRNEATKRITLPCGCMRILCPLHVVPLTANVFGAVVAGVKIGTYRCGICGITSTVNPSKLYTITGLP